MLQLWLPSINVVRVLKTLPLEECSGRSWMLHNVFTSYFKLNSLSSGVFLCFGSLFMWETTWSCSCFPDIVPVQFLCSSTVPGCSCPHCTWRTQLSTSPPPLYRHQPTPFKPCFTSNPSLQMTRGVQSCRTVDCNALSTSVNHVQPCPDTRSTKSDSSVLFFAVIFRLKSNQNKPKIS